MPFHQIFLRKNIDSRAIEDPPFIYFWKKRLKIDFENGNLFNFDQVYVVCFKHMAIFRTFSWFYIFLKTRWLFETGHLLEIRSVREI